MSGRKIYRPVDLAEVRTYAIASRQNKVNVTEHFARPPRAGASFAEFLAGLPDLLGA